MPKEYLTSNAFEAVDLGAEGRVFDRLVIYPKIDPLTVIEEGTKLPLLTGVIFNPSTKDFEQFDIQRLAETPIIVASPSKFHPDSPDCEDQAIKMEVLSNELHGSATVVEFVRQTPEDVKKFVQKKDLTHPIVSVSTRMAHRMGALIRPALFPDGTPAADTHFWTSDTTARTLTVATQALEDEDGQRIVVHRQREADQGTHLNLLAARYAVESISGK